MVLGKKNIGVLVLLTWSLTNEVIRASHIIINKKNIQHTFVSFDKATDEFVRNVFSNWENETFDVFDAVKDPQGIAIDLGAWIGTTSIWLSKNFHHVIAVDADTTSLKCLHMNLSASECNNVSICDRPVGATSKRVVFGPRGSVLNESISCIKDVSDKSSDYTVHPIPFIQLIHDYIYQNDAINQHKISFIKCDIEGGEENILEDILCFAHRNKCKAYISFHTAWWHSRKIEEFEYLFKFFKTNCPQKNICEYINQNPFGSILFEPINDSGALIKKDLPVVIIGYNLVTYIKNMVQQLEKYTSNIIVIDNNSSYEPLLNYYRNEFEYTLLCQRTNFGHTVYNQEYIQKLVGNVFFLTDPDLQFNPQLPHNFMSILIDISKHFEAGRVGFALSIDSENIRSDILLWNTFSIKEWESQFWKKRIHYSNKPDIELYEAAIDTTFCLVNKSAPRQELNIRVAGDYTCLHLPWYKDFLSKLEIGECEAYKNGNISTNWFRG